MIYRETYKVLKNKIYLFLFIVLWVLFFMIIYQSSLFVILYRDIIGITFVCSIVLFATTGYKQVSSEVSIEFLDNKLVITRDRKYDSYYGVVYELIEFDYKDITALSFIKRTNTIEIYGRHHKVVYIRNDEYISKCPVYDKTVFGSIFINSNDNINKVYEKWRNLNESIS